MARVAKRTERALFRVTPEQREKLKHLAESNGVTMTRVLEVLLDSIEVPGQQKSAVPTYQAKHSAFA